MTANRTYIGDPITDPQGNDYGVYVEQWANEAPDLLVIDGYACGLYLDPGTTTGRAAITGLITNLQAALHRHDADVAAIYANLKPGDDPSCIRVANDKETRCKHINGTHQCVRVEHVDAWHVTTTRDYTVRSVWRA